MEELRKEIAELKNQNSKLQNDLYGDPDSLSARAMSDYIERMKVFNLKVELSNLNVPYKSSFRKRELADILKTHFGVSKKVKRNTPVVPPYLTPVGITPELLKFLDLPAETLISRTDVTRKITQWIKDNGIQEVDNRNIKINDKKAIPLKKLLEFKGKIDTERGMPFTFFMMQKYLKNHFVEEAPFIPTKLYTGKLKGYEFRAENWPRATLGSGYYCVCHKRCMACAKRSFYCECKVKYWKIGEWKVTRTGISFFCTHSSDGTCCCIECKLYKKRV